MAVANNKQYKLKLNLNDGTSVETTTPKLYTAPDSGIPKSDLNPNALNTAGATDTANKIYLIGAASQGANPQTYSDSQVYTTNGQLDANKVRIAEKATMQYNPTDKCIDFIFV